MEEHKKIDSIETLAEGVAKVKEAQEKFREYSQEKVDKIFKEVAIKANMERIPLAKLAVEEIGRASCRERV